MSSKIARSLVAVIAVCFFTVDASAQQARPKLDVNIFNHIPGDAVFAMVVPGTARSAQAVKEMVLDVAGPAGQMLAGFEPLDLLLEDLPLGKGLDRNGSAGFVVLDPEKHSRIWLQRRAQDAPSPTMGEAAEEYPWALILPVSDPDTFFAQEVPVRKQGEFYQIGTEAWAKVCSDHMVIAARKETLTAFPAEVNIMTRMTPEHEKMIVRDHLWIIADWKRLRQLHSKDLLPDMFSMMGLTGHSSPMAMMYLMSGAMPAIYPLGWVYMTRSENFSEATMMAAGLSFTGQAIRIETRWTYPEDSHMARALEKFKKPDHPLIRNLPDAEGLFVYGADKSFRSPEALKTRQYRKLIEKVGELTGLKKKEGGREKLEKLTGEVGQVISALQGQVLSVEHCFGVDFTDERAIQLGTVAKVKDSARVMQTAAKIPERINVIFAEHGFMPFRLVSRERKDLSTEGMRVFEIALTDGEKNKPEELPEEVSKILGDKYFRIYVASAGKDTVITSLGGGEAFFEKMLQIAKTGNTFQMSDAWKKTQAMLPENRAVEFYISPARLVEMMKFALGRVEPHIVDEIPAFPSNTPLGAAVAVEKNDMSIVAVIPYDVPKSIVLMQMKMSSGGADGP